MAHSNIDEDSSVDATHHTLGTHAFQASPGNHTHNGRNSFAVAPLAPLAKDNVVATNNNALLQDKLALALTTNADFLAIANPNPQDVKDQTIALTKQINALIRLLTHQYATTSGT